LHEAKLRVSRKPDVGEKSIRGETKLRKNVVAGKKVMRKEGKKFKGAEVDQCPTGNGAYELEERQNPRLLRHLKSK